MQEKKKDEKTNTQQTDQAKSEEARKPERETPSNPGVDGKNVRFSQPTQQGDQDRNQQERKVS